ncbi:MAG: GNAT family N-acetyltransferase [Bacillota bacterium]
MSYQIRQSTPADFPRIVAILNSQINEPITLEEYVRQDKARPQSDPYLRLVAEREGGEIAGFGVSVHESHNRPGEFFIRVRVDGPHQNQGIGSALFQRLESFARENGATRLESGVREQDTQAYTWAQRRGFALENHLFESTRTLSDWDPTPYQEAVEKAKADGFRFATLAELTAGLEPEEMFRRYYEFFIPIVHDIPSNEDRPRTPFEEWHNWVKDDPEFKPEQILLAVEGESWAAVAALRKTASGALYNDFTGVARDYRGRGLTLALKVEVLNLARSLGAPYIRTNNLSINPRILAVNRKLGYIPSPGHFLLAKKLG